MLRSLCHVLILLILALPVAKTATAAASAAADSASLLSQAQAANPVRYNFALNKQAEIRHTSDNKSYTMWWQPGTGTPKGVIVTLHGHGSYATDEFYLWQPYAEKYGYAVLALQWWFGGGEATADYYAPDEMYPLLVTSLRGKGVLPGTALFVGYSRASANSYALAALDNTGTGSHFFGLVLSNSGGAMSNYPPNQKITNGGYGGLPFAGVNWAMYCGELDPDPTINGCPAMTAAKTWVTTLGASVLLFIDDPTGDHGGFMTHSANVETALATYATVLATSATAPTCTLSASTTTLSVGSASALTTSCSPAATAYAWTGGTCAGTSGAGCTVTPAATTTYTVAGSNAAGWGPAASVTVNVSDKTAPTVPAGLQSTAVSSSQVSLGWSAASDNAGVTAYKVYRNGSQVGSPSTTSYTDTSLAAATAYTYTVAACDAAGNCSAQSGGLKVTTATAVVKPSCTLTASVSSLSPGGSSTLTARCTPAAKSYSWTGGSCAGSNATSCTVSPPSTTTYTVTGSNDGGAGSAVSVTITVGETTPTPPPVTPPVTPKTDVLDPPEADCLFNWAEDHYASALNPPRPASATVAPYYFRRYTGSNSYLGVSATDNHLYYVDSAGRFTDLGLAATWSTQAGCR